MKRTVHNLHVPLPDALYQDLKRIAGQASQPLTEVAREAIRAFVAERERQQTYREICEYAAAAAGTHEDLDPLLEAAGIDHLQECEPE